LFFKEKQKIIKCFIKNILKEKRIYKITMTTDNTIHLKFGKDYINDYGKIKYSNKFKLNGEFFGKVNEKFGKKSIGYSLSDENNIKFLETNGIKTYNSIHGNHCYISLKDNENPSSSDPSSFSTELKNEIPDETEFVMKCFTNKKGIEFKSLILSI
jgi:hypothetical protein